MNRIYANLGVSDLFDQTDSFVTSPIFSPIVLAFIRLLFAVYALATFLVVLIWNGVKLHDAGTYVSPSTNFVHASRAKLPY